MEVPDLIGEDTQCSQGCNVVSHEKVVEQGHEFAATTLFTFLVGACVPQSSKDHEFSAIVLVVEIERSQTVCNMEDVS